MITKIQFTYNAYDNRFYAIRGDKLYSFGFDGSDMKLLYSFGERGDIDKEPYIYEYSSTPGQLKAYNNYVYMCYADSETGKNNLLRLNTRTKKLENLTEDIDFNIGEYCFLGDKIYVKAYNTVASSGMATNIKTYACDLNLETMTEIPLFNVSGFSDGKVVFNDITEERNGADICVGFNIYDPETGTMSCVYTSDGDDGALTMMCVTEKYIYFSEREEILLGSSPYTGEGNIYNYRPCIYRLDRETEEVTEILRDESLSFDGLMISDGFAIAYVTKYKSSSSGIAESSDYIAYTVSDDGRFVPFD